MKNAATENLLDVTLLAPSKNIRLFLSALMHCKPVIRYHS